MTRNQALKLTSLATFTALFLLGLEAWKATAQVPPTAEISPLSEQMNIWQAAFLGMVQGLTEFIPISSTAHLKAIPVFLGWGDPGVTFTAVIQLGSIGAVLWYFWRDLVQITQGAWGAIQRRDYEHQDYQMALGIGLGTLPILFFGGLLKIFVPDYDNSPLRSMAAIAAASILMSLLLGIAERLGKRKRNFTDLNVWDGINMGLAQALALMPGVSRSGSTITAGLFIGLERATAARFSFLLGLPAITLAGIVEFVGVLKDGFATNSLANVFIGLVSAAIFSYLSIVWLIRFLQTRSTWLFIWYRLIFGVVILSAIATGLIENS
ncbi:undecaprenyl-diphosphate phosphatase [Geitlerinema calcuttense]